MIVKKYWHKGIGYSRRNYMGIFLFGFIPLYIVKSDEGMMLE
jgi:hypothetical protein